jgi:putative DNA methylase
MARRTVKTRRKLIEVALPLDVINEASVREKSIRHGHPSTLHLWWARRPLASARAVIFAQMVDDPSSVPDLFPDDTAQDQERQRLFGIIRDLVQWGNSTNESALESARQEIRQSWQRACVDNADHPQAADLFNPNRLPSFHDPFAGGGTLPLEAQRLGLEAFASDLNPVAVLINKAMIEVPARFDSVSPVNAKARSEQTLIERRWRDAQGIAEDLRNYGQWIRDEAERRMGNLYPPVDVTPEIVKTRPDLKPYVGQQLTVVAWLWTRTVKSPNPAFASMEVPLVSTFMLSTKAGKESYVEPLIESDRYSFVVKIGRPHDAEVSRSGTKLGRGANFRCLISGAPISSTYIHAEARAGRMGSRLLAIVAEAKHGRVYLSPTAEQEAVAQVARPTWKPDLAMPDNPRWFSPPLYGLTTYGDLFTPRQLVALTTFSDLVREAMARVNADAIAAGLYEDSKHLRDGGTGALAYSEAIGVYLAFALSKLADRGSTICTWFTERDSTRNTFARQSIPMTWDYAELNTLLNGTGSFVGAVGWTAESVDGLGAGRGSGGGESTQADATTQVISRGKVVSTDPPYYDNISYAELSDFFYVWLRRTLRLVFPDLFSTLAVPKVEELVATPYRHGSKQKAQAFFLDGMTEAIHSLAEQVHPCFPVTIYYAFKQSETATTEGTTSTGWETFLDALIESGFGISGTWPIRTELSNRMVGSGTNALASSIVLVCRPRADGAPRVTRREFVEALKSTLPPALRQLQAGNVAPVDLAQAAIGPGMAIFTEFNKVLDAQGKAVSVREALALINQILDEALAEQEGDFDAESRWAITWFEQNGFAEGDFGIAEQLSKSKNTSVDGLAGAKILQSRRGKVRLLKPQELPIDWDLSAERRLTAWEMVHQLIRALDSGGESAAASLLAKLGTKADVARELAYRLYSIAERKKRAAEALAYNGLVQNWPQIADRARETPGQPDLFAVGT